MIVTILRHTLLCHLGNEGRRRLLLKRVLLLCYSFSPELDHHYLDIGDDIDPEAHQEETLRHNITLLAHSPKTIKPSRLGLLNTPTAFLQRGKSTPTNECPGYYIK